MSIERCLGLSGERTDKWYIPPVPFLPAPMYRGESRRVGTCSRFLVPPVPPVPIYRGFIGDSSGACRGPACPDSSGMYRACPDPIGGSIGDGI